MNSVLQLDAVLLLLPDLRWGFMNSEAKECRAARSKLIKRRNMPQNRPHRPENVASLSDILWLMGPPSVGPLFAWTCRKCLKLPLVADFQFA